MSLYHVFWRLWTDFLALLTYKLPFLYKKRAYVLRHHGNSWWMKVSTHLPIREWQHKNPVRVCLWMWRSPCLWMHACVKTSPTKNKVGGNALSHSLKSRLGRHEYWAKKKKKNGQRSRFVPEKMQEGNKLKQSSASSSRGNRKRLGEPDSGSCTPGTIKISLRQEADLRQREPDRFCWRAAAVTLDGARAGGWPCPTISAQMFFDKVSSAFSGWPVAITCGKSRKILNFCWIRPALKPDELPKLIILY